MSIFGPMFFRLCSEFWDNYSYSGIIIVIGTLWVRNPLGEGEMWNRNPLGEGEMWNRKPEIGFNEFLKLGLMIF